MGHLTIISYGINPSLIAESAKAIIADSAILVAGKRVLDIFPRYTGEKVVLGADAVQKSKELAELAKKNKIVVLASGDSLYNGIGKRFSDYLPVDMLTIIPNITAFQALFAKIHFPWESAQLFSVHGKNRILPYRQILVASTAVIYCDYKMTASELAKEFILRIPQSCERLAVIAENLGMDNEFIKKGSLNELSKLKSSSLSILVLLPSEDKITDSGMVLGLNDSEFLHQNNLITHSEVRAIIISKLKLGSGIMWDLGAGSGSVGIESASLSADLSVFSVEKEKLRCLDIAQNIIDFGLTNIELIENDILKSIENLPAPRSIFIGGGGKDIAEIAKKAFDRLLPAGRMLVSAVLLETQSAMTSILKKECLEVVSVSISKSKKLADNTLMKAENTITLFVYRK